MVQIRTPWVVTSSGPVSDRKSSKRHMILENDIWDPTIKRVHAPTNVNGCTKYEQDPSYTVCCRVVTRAGPNNSQYVFIKFQSATGFEKMNIAHRYPIINRVYAPTEVNVCPKYEPDPLNIGGCISVTRVSPNTSVYPLNFNRIRENEHKNLIIYRVQTSTEVNSCTKYEWDILIIVGCRTINKLGQKVGWMDGWKDRQCRALYNNWVVR